MSTVSAPLTSATAAAAATTASSSSSSSSTRCFNDYHFSSFVAMEQLVTVLPRFTMSAVECLAGSYGPFAPNRPARVPLWLALYLRQSDTCTLVAPSFVRLPYVQGVLAREQASESSFEALPFYFYEVVKLIAEHGGDDVANMAEVVRVVDHIHTLRRSKLQRSMSVFEAEGSPMYIPGIKLTNLVSNELHYLRSSFAIVLEQACRMDVMRQRRVAAADGDGSRSSLAAFAPPLPPPIRPPAAGRLSQLMQTPSSLLAGSGASVTDVSSHRGSSLTATATTTTRAATTTTDVSLSSQTLSQATTMTTTAAASALTPDAHDLAYAPGARRRRAGDVGNDVASDAAMTLSDDAYTLTQSTDAYSVAASRGQGSSSISSHGAAASAAGGIAYGVDGGTLATMTTNTMTNAMYGDGTYDGSSLAASSDMDAVAAAAAAAVQPPAPKKRRTLRQT